MTSRDTCRYPSCDRAPGQQDREDYNARRFCSIQCETAHEHIVADARDALRAAEREAPAGDRHPGERGEFV